MQIATKPVTYKDADTTLNGIFFWDESLATKRPGVLVIHGGAGLDDHAKNRARRFAELGYVAFACDMYGEGVAGNRERIMARIAELRAEPDRLPRRANAGIEVLRTHPLTDDHIAAVGYCFGGMTISNSPAVARPSLASSASTAASTQSAKLRRPTPSKRRSSSATAHSTLTSL